jgi:hypothetical protein
VIPLRARKPKEALLQIRILSIPKRKCEIEKTTVIAETKETVFAPTVCSRSRRIVRKMVPSIAAWRVILTNGPPLALAQIVAPTTPLFRAARFFEPFVLRRRESFCAVSARRNTPSMFNRHGATMVPRVKSES